MRILLVEDQAGILRTLTEALAEAGHEVGGATTFGLGEAMLAGLSWEALITDVRLPGGNGLDLAAQAQHIGVPTLLLTGHPDDIASLAARGTPHLSKPFSHQDLTDWLDSVQRLASGNADGA